MEQKNKHITNKQEPLLLLVLEVTTNKIKLYSSYSLLFS